MLSFDYTLSGTNFQVYNNNTLSGSGSATVNAETSNTIIASRGDGVISFYQGYVSLVATWKNNKSANRNDIYSQIKSIFTTLP